jgi:hypothetical protein
MPGLAIQHSVDLLGANMLISENSFIVAHIHFVTRDHLKSQTIWQCNIAKTLML